MIINGTQFKQVTVECLKLKVLRVIYSFKLTQESWKKKKQEKNSKRNLIFGYWTQYHRSMFNRYGTGRWDAILWISKKINLWEILQSISKVTR